jgi:RNA polymerase sigma-70 factor, ECF subfamily
LLPFRGFILGGGDVLLTFVSVHKNCPQLIQSTIDSEDKMTLDLFRGEFTVRLPFELSSAEEERLIQRIQEGDLRASRRFYDCYAPLVYKFIHFRIANEEESQELAAQVFINVWRALPAYQKRGKPTIAWILEFACEQVKAAQVNHRWPRFLSWLPWRKDPVAAAKDQSDGQGELRRALDGLLCDQQLIIYFSFIEDFSNQEIACFLGISEDKVRSAKIPALKQLGKVLKGAR